MNVNITFYMIFSFLVNYNLYSKYKTNIIINNKNKIDIHLSSLLALKAYPNSPFQANIFQ